jgi:hypothetical protein
MNDLLTAFADYLKILMCLKTARFIKVKPLLKTPFSRAFGLCI